jgi:sialidase-1
VTHPKDVTHHIIHEDSQHCVNQVATRVVAGGDIVAVFNEERFPYHHDSGQTVLTRSSDGGITWTEPQVVLPWTQNTGNWDCGFCELPDGTWMINLTICGYFKRGVKPEGVSWSTHPQTGEWGDWTWAHKLQGWLGTYVIKSTDQGRTWSEPIPVNARPMKHAGCRLGAWTLPTGSVVMGV